MQIEPSEGYYLCEGLTSNDLRACRIAIPRHALEQSRISLARVLATWKYDREVPTEAPPPEEKNQHAGAIDEAAVWRSHTTQELRAREIPRYKVGDILIHRATADTCRFQPDPTNSDEAFVFIHETLVLGKTREPEAGA